ncbi:23S rRNA (pseudouridine(1915)-N(3))-methyltransferase RlmH [Mollicutes bacterium LVI A0039]|nr:23S rRNA (pseudouridine(1915)-N(3))-methyltransferase RlmH [Mollicutes bacterium LVI A0039]
MQIDLIVVGKLKEKSMQQMCNEYIKRLGSYCKLNVIELKDESNNLDENIVIEREAAAINKVLDEKSYLIILDIDGKQLSSEQFSQKLDEITTYENSKLTFIIGGSLGISSEIKAKANLRLSFSKMTFPHQLFRVMLLEQIYRQFRIARNEPYHK